MPCQFQNSYTKSILKILYTKNDSHKNCWADELKVTSYSDYITNHIPPSMKKAFSYNTADDNNIDINEKVACVAADLHAEQSAPTCLWL